MKKAGEKESHEKKRRKRKKDCKKIKESDIRKKRRNRNGNKVKYSWQTPVPHPVNKVPLILVCKFLCADPELKRLPTWSK